MTDFKRWLIMAPVAAGFIAATVCAASAQDRQPGFLDNLFGGSERLAPSAEPAQGQYQGQGQGQGQGRQERSNELMVRLERLEGQIRQLTGAIEELQHRNQQLEAQLQDVRGVPRASTGAVVPPAASRPTMPPPVAPATAAPGRRGDVFDPSQNPTAPGAPHVLGSPASASVPLPQATEPSEEAAAGPDGAPLDLSTLSDAAARDPSLATPGRMASGGQGSPAPARGPRAGEQLATLPPSDSPKDNFDLAYGYVMRKDYALAQDGFRSFLTRFPNDRLAPDAYYWLGESLFQSQQYRDAAESFLTVSTKYETTGRAPEALLRLGQSLAALGEKEAACASLGEVLRKYPRASVGVKQGVDREQKRARC